MECVFHKDIGKQNNVCSVIVGGVLSIKRTLDEHEETWLMFVHCEHCINVFVEYYLVYCIHI